MINSSIYSYLTTTRIFVSAFFLFFPIFSEIHAECLGKFDFGPAYIHVDVLESNHTIKSVDMPGLKVDGYYLVWKGVCIKPNFLYAGKSNTQIASGGCGIGHFFPIGKKCSITPSVGCNFTQFRTLIHNYPIVPGLVFLDLRERFRSVSPYAAIEASYCFCKGWRIVGMYQYVWSRTITRIKGFKDTKSSPKGSNYSVMIESDINEKWSVNLGAAYNTSLTKEKHGLRGYGVRWGFAYWF